MPFAIHIIAGGTAGMAEAVSSISCPLFGLADQMNDTNANSCAANPWIRSKSVCSSLALEERLVYVCFILVNVLLLCSHAYNIRCFVLQTKARGFLATGLQIARRETPLALYKGLGAVLSGIVPKMAIRFASFEAYKDFLADKSTGQTSTGMVFFGKSPLAIFNWHTKD